MRSNEPRLLKRSSEMHVFVLLKIVLLCVLYYKFFVHDFIYDSNDD